MWKAILLFMDNFVWPNSTQGNQTMFKKYHGLARNLNLNSCLSSNPRFYLVFVESNQIRFIKRQCAYFRLRHIGSETPNPPSFHTACWCISYKVCGLSVVNWDIAKLLPTHNMFSSHDDGATWNKFEYFAKKPSLPEKVESQHESLRWFKKPLSIFPFPLSF